MSTDGEVLKRLAQLEKKVSELYKALGRAEPDFAVGEFSDEVRNLVLTGKKMDAVKLYREQTGGDLSEAAEIVERIANGEA